jgi:hypothetical protein
MASKLQFLRAGISDYARLGTAVREFLAAPPIADPESAVRKHLANREAAFLDGVQRVIFSNPSNPYFRMFQAASCNWEDLRRKVQTDGLESTLEDLRRNGVYLAHDEFKGMLPIIRDGLEIPAGPRAFVSGAKPMDIPNVSSGSRSQGTDTRIRVEMRLHSEAYEHLLLRELGLLEHEQLVVFPVLPSSAGYLRSLRAGRRGQRARWFAPGGSLRDGGRQALATKWMMMVAKASGVNAPLPEGLPPSDFSAVVTHILRRRDQGRRCWVHAMVTSAVRIAGAASEKGEDLEGATFGVTGEALSAAKRAVIERTGAKVWPFYASTELSFMGAPCQETNAADSVHLLSDSLAVISHRKKAELSDCEVDSLLFTTLLPYSPFLVINLEMDDSGVIGRAQCDCTLARLGLTTTIGNIFSFGKLTGMGVTLLGTQLLELLERTLPATFGGAPGDYQLLESEEAGEYRVTLRISPRVALPPIATVKAMFLKTVDSLYGGRVTTRVWTHGDALRIAVAEPVATRSGKVLPLHLLRGA